MGQPPYCSAANAGLWGERGYDDGPTPYTWLSSITLLPWLPGFPPQAFSPQSPPSYPLDLSLHSQQQPSLWDCSTIPKLQLPDTTPSRVWMAVARTVWFSFHLGCHRSAVSLSALNVSPLTQTIALVWGLDPCFSSPTHREQVQSYSHSRFFPLIPSSYWVLCESIYSFPLLRYSCLLSAGVLHALLCLKVYCWYIYRDRCTPLPPTPPPSCSSCFIHF